MASMAFVLLKPKGGSDSFCKRTYIYLSFHCGSLFVPGWFSPSWVLMSYYLPQHSLLVEQVLNILCVSVIVQMSTVLHVARGKQISVVFTPQFSHV